MNRRHFITLLGGAAAAWPLAASAQQAAKIATSGFLDATSRRQGQMVPVFVERLRELGWQEGRNLTVKVRWAEGRPERYAEIAEKGFLTVLHSTLTAGAIILSQLCSVCVLPSLPSRCAIVPTRLRSLFPLAPPCACAGGKRRAW